jgi:hypothetical protein
MKLKTQLTVLALALTGAIGSAQATALVINTPTTSVDHSGTFFGGSMVASHITNINNLSYQGTARTEVYDTGTGLDFYYQFSNASTSRNGVERFSAWDFSALGSSVVNVFQTNAAFGNFIVGTEQSDYADRTGLGVIGFNFIANDQSKINPGTTSYVQVIRTNARTFEAGNFGLLNGIGDNAIGYGVSAVPEPESFAMMLAGLGLMATIARRRKSRQV